MKSAAGTAGNVKGKQMELFVVIFSSNEHVLLARSHHISGYSWTSDIIWTRLMASMINVVEFLSSLGKTLQISSFCDINTIYVCNLDVENKNLLILTCLLPCNISLLSETSDGSQNKLISVD